MQGSHMGRKSRNRTGGVADRSEFKPSSGSKDPRLKALGRYDELDQNPELADLILSGAVISRIFQLHSEGQSLDQTCLKTLMYDWIEPVPARSLKLAKSLLAAGEHRDPLSETLRKFLQLAQTSRQIRDALPVTMLLQGNAKLATTARILWSAGKRGRPIKLRQAAVRALIRRTYLHKPWLEITRRVCPCGKSHVGVAGTYRAKAECQPKLQSEVRILKRLLRECKVELGSVWFGGGPLLKPLNT